MPSATTIFSLISQSQFRLVFQWTAPSNGGSTIIDYYVLWDQGTGVYVQLASTTFGATTYEQQLAADGG